ncbi:PD40 domain-containing protein [Flavobacterium psychrotolerans]|uniref:Uncharacterized protein n=1 Tax=Flavobacterium psychrotolerans TaxID=2169410 RepID=A0A2U1JJB9_9FLAO|nr:PD40 domain-containing protein [Flavobacterium psychrotolerans]PWA04953.1 hypothetical protein DB895_09300 [Flavobacterium psychrotolerans]
MKKYTVIIGLFLLGLSVQSQQVQWASKLIKFSSDLGGKQNGIKRILGKPDAFPQGGSSPNAWSPKNALNGYEVIEVGFEKPQIVKQVAVFENLNAGCVVKIAVDDGSGSYKTVWNRKKDWKTPTFKASISADHNYYFKRKRRKIQEAPDVINPGIENVILENAVSNAVAVKVEFNFALFPGQKQVDAIGISDSEVLIEAKINSNSIFENLPNPELIPLGHKAALCPVVSQNGNTLYFTNSASEKEQIYSCSKMADDKWSQPVLESALNTNENYNYIEFAASDFMLLGGANFIKGTGESGFSILNGINGKQQDFETIKIAAFNNYDDTADATITQDKKIMILGIETDFTQGGTDLYFTSRKDDGTYSLLQSMGKIVNSAANEATPQLLSDTKTLLFSSNGFSNFGDYDIFIAYRLDDSWKKWSEPVNMGSKINGNGFDASPYYDEKSETLYYTKFIDGEMSLCFVKIPKIDLIEK